MVSYQTWNISLQHSITWTEAKFLKGKFEKSTRKVPWKYQESYMKIPGQFLENTSTREVTWKYKESSLKVPGKIFEHTRKVTGKYQETSLKVPENVLESTRKVTWKYQESYLKVTTNVLESTRKVHWKYQGISLKVPGKFLECTVVMKKLDFLWCFVRKMFIFCKDFFRSAFLSTHIQWKYSRPRENHFNGSLISMCTYFLLVNST